MAHGKRRNIKFDEQAFRELDREYRLNEGRDPLVSAFNRLPADDRAIMLAYIVMGHNKKNLARLMGVSWPVVDERIWRIQVVVEEQYRRLRSEDDF